MAEPQLEAAAVAARATINALVAGIVHVHACGGAAGALVIGVMRPRAAAPLAAKRALLLLLSTHVLLRRAGALRSGVRLGKRLHSQVQVSRQARLKRPRNTRPLAVVTRAPLPREMGSV